MRPGLSPISPPLSTACGPKLTFCSCSTPTIGLACQNWSLIHPPPTERDDKVSSLYLSYADMPNIGNILRDLKTKLPHEEMEISVR